MLVCYNFVWKSNALSSRISCTCCKMARIRSKLSACPKNTHSSIVFVTNNLNQHVFQKQNFSAKEGAARAKKVRRRFLDGTSHSSVGWNKKSLLTLSLVDTSITPFSALWCFQKAQKCFSLNKKYAATFFQVRKGPPLFLEDRNESN
jgi:hypothetical protein